MSNTKRIAHTLETSVTDQPFGTGNVLNLRAIGGPLSAFTVNGKQIDPKEVLKAARGDRSEYFVWNNATRCYQASYDQGLFDLVDAMKTAMQANIPQPTEAGAIVAKASKANAEALTSELFG